MMSKRRALMMAQGGAEPQFYINGYVGNGLLHYWDGIDNRGIGESHASSGFPWVDLAGNRDIVLNDRIETATWVSTSFTDSAWTQTNSNRSHFRLEDVRVPYPEFTIECRGFSDAETHGPLFGFWANIAGGASRTLVILEPTSNTIGAIFKGSGQWAGYVKYQEQYSNAPITLALSYKAGEDKMTLYADGVLFSKFTPLPNVSEFNSRFQLEDTHLEIGATSPNNNLVLPNGGLIHRMMVYDRVLTPAEILSNYQNDLTRFT